MQENYMTRTVEKGDIELFMEHTADADDVMVWRLQSSPE